MTPEQVILWQKIRYLPIDDPKSALPFSARLARDNGWELDFALRAIDEYKKFILLAATLPHPVTPSDQVDQVWHLHLLYTRSYWDELCQKILQKPLHHDPTRGGSGERGKFRHWYDYTLESYRQVFGAPPPQDIWPPAEIRFGLINFIRVNTDTHWVIPKSGWWLLIKNQLKRLCPPHL
jgi:hypothetical protein